MTQSTLQAGSAADLIWQPAEPHAHGSDRERDAPEPLICGFTAGAVCGQLDLRQPQQGIVLGGGPQPPTVLAVRLPPPATCRLADSWVRGGDAVAIHEPRDSRRLRITSCWQLASTPTELIIQLVLSAQTAAVRSDGATAVDCLLTAGDVSIGIANGSQIEWSPAATAVQRGSLLVPRWRQLPETAVLCLLFRQAAAANSLAILLRRDEGREVILRKTPAAESSGVPRFALSAWFFPTLIEKGVLHRSRIQVAVGDAAEDRKWTAAAANRLARQQPLLQ